VIFNPRPNYPISVLTGGETYPPVSELREKIKHLSKKARVVQATELAKELGALVAQNVVMVGALAGSGLLPIPLSSFKNTIEEIFEGSEKKRDFNMKALEIGVRGFEEGKDL